MTTIRLLICFAVIAVFAMWVERFTGVHVATIPFWKFSLVGAPDFLAGACTAYWMMHNEKRRSLREREGQ